MPVIIEVLEPTAAAAIKSAFNYFEAVDKKFSTYKPDSEVSLLNAGKISAQQASPEFAEVLSLAELTKQQTNGYFDIYRNGQCDPSGLVKGWAIRNAAEILSNSGFNNFYVDAGGDIQASGHNSEGKKWTVGIRNPFNREQIVKVLQIEDRGVATSGTYIRGEHIYNPKTGVPANEIASLTVIGPDVYEADRFATAAFAMGKSGIAFLERLPGFEAYMIGHDGTATLTSGLDQYFQLI